MYIQLDVFAEMLGIRPGELLHAVRTDGQLGGLVLPACRKVSGAAVMFGLDETIAFSQRWKTHTQTKAVPASGGELMPLHAAAELAGIMPLELWQATRARKKLKGVTVPAVVKTRGSVMMFEPAAVAQFVRDYREACMKASSS